jgi:hypothetical protein
MIAEGDTGKSRAYQVFLPDPREVGGRNVAVRSSVSEKRVLAANFGGKIYEGACPRPHQIV